MNIQNLKDEFHEKTLIYRSIDNIIQSYDFELLFNSSDDKVKQTIANYVLTGNKARLRTILRNLITDLKPFEQMSMTRLRNIAGHLRVSNYKDLTKDRLIKEIEDVIKRVKESNLKFAIGIR